jgi:hypothetical protein
MNFRTKYRMHSLAVISVTMKDVMVTLRGDLTRSCYLTGGSRLWTTKPTRTATTPRSDMNKSDMLLLVAPVVHTKYN